MKNLLIFCIVFLAFNRFSSSLELRNKAFKSSGRLSKIRSNGEWFLDEDGRVMIFHGLNAVQKGYPWYPSNLKNMTKLENFRKWGFNVVRLGFMWSGLYPEKNKLDQNYVNEMFDIINDLQSKGMYVIIDLHQDMMSTKFNAYDGVPLWVVDELPDPKHEFPWPFKKKDLGFSAYVTDACGFAFECLYKNQSNFETYFHQYWTTTAKLLSNFSSVLGYELINEPWAGDIYNNPFYLLPGVAGQQNLLPLYDRVYQEIKKYDKNTLIFYEPVTWSVMSNKQVLSTGFNRPPAYDPLGTVLSWHYYCWLFNVDPNPLINGTYPEFVREFCDVWQLNDYFKTITKDLKQLGSTSFLTEFGGCTFSFQGYTNTQECRYILNYTDSFFTSWTYWNSDFYYNDGNINFDVVNVFSRVYPTATNGIPVTMYYNSTTRYFNYTYTSSITSLKQANLVTEIFLPGFLYPNGFKVTLSDDLTWKYDQDNSKVLVFLKASVIQEFILDELYTYEGDHYVQIESSKDTF